MTVEADEQRSDVFYADFYRAGGWPYSYRKEAHWHRRHLVKRFGLRRGMRILEVACGNGMHTDMLNRMGFDCVGVDRSRTGIAWARNHYPGSRYYCEDLRDMTFEPGGFDMVLARGCSHYHYDLLSPKCIETTTTLIRYLKPGGVFVMIIRTNLSGKREPDEIWHNTLDDYRRHFSRSGLEHSVDFVDGMAICALYASPLPTRSRQRSRESFWTREQRGKGTSLIVDNLKKRGWGGWFTCLRHALPWGWHSLFPRR